VGVRKKEYTEEILEAREEGGKKTYKKNEVAEDVKVHYGAKKKGKSQKIINTGCSKGYHTATERGPTIQVLGKTEESYQFKELPFCGTSNPPGRVLRGRVGKDRPSAKKVATYGRRTFTWVSPSRGSGSNITTGKLGLEKCHSLFGRTCFRGTKTQGGNYAVREEGIIVSAFGFRKGHDETGKPEKERP